MTLVPAYAALFGWAFAAATVLPVDASFALAGIVAADGDPWIAVPLATAGNVLGAWTTFWLGGRLRGLRQNPGPREARALGWLGRYGAPALLASWVPVVGDVVVAMAGVSGIPLTPFLVWTTIGKAGRYMAVAALVSL